MKLSKNHLIDPMTNLPNFISFFTDDFQEVYGDSGTLLMCKPRTMKEINSVYGREIGDEFFKDMAAYFHREVNMKTYRHEGGFLTVYKGQDDTLAKNHADDMSRIVEECAAKHNVERVRLHSIIVPYYEPLHTIADYYHLFYEMYQEENKHASSKEMLHYILQGISYRINELIVDYESARDYALYDEISGLPNSKSADMYLDEVERSIDKYAILFIDGDALKRFNDVSYENGNRAIKEIAEVIEKSVRKSDRVFRWLSGDEFIVVATEVSQDNIAILAERIRSNVEARFKHRDIAATISIGISMYPNDGHDVISIIDNAENANKKAKSNGKNQFVFHENISG